jgi:hypothetical protein
MMGLSFRPIFINRRCPSIMNRVGWNQALKEVSCGPDVTRPINYLPFNHGE